MPEKKSMSTGKNFIAQLLDSLETKRTGIILEQNKEPALSREMRTFFTPKLEFKKIRAYHPKEPVEQIEIPLPDETAAAQPADGRVSEPADIINIAKRGKIIDETSGKPLFELLTSAKKNGYSSIVIDAMDDEPYISSQIAPAMQMSDRLARGLELAKTATGIEKAEIEIYKNLFDSQIKIGTDIAGIPVVRVGGGYPAEQRATRRERAKGALVLGACSLIHLARAVDDGRVQTTCFVTVAGDCVAMPVNLEVTMDKTLDDVLNFCGMMFDPSRVVIGGSMTGFSITDLATTNVTPMTRGVLAFKETFKEYNYTCIGCGRCAEVCPQGLSPYYIYKLVQSGRYGALKNFDIDMCIGCGTCSYICPAKLEISMVVAKGKRDILKYEAQQAERRHQRRIALAAQHEQEERERLEAEERARVEAEERARVEAEERARVEAEEKARLEADEKAYAASGADSGWTRSDQVGEPAETQTDNQGGKS